MSIRVAINGLLRIDRRRSHQIMNWYDNDWGYVAQMVREGLRMVKPKKAAA